MQVRARTKKAKAEAQREAKRPRCIICDAQKDGIAIKADNVVNALRWLNSHTVRYRNPTRPVVCRECFPKYMKRRKSYERKLITYLVIGFLFAGFIVFASRANPVSFLFGFGVIALMYLLSLISYVPPLDIPRQMLHGLLGRGGGPAEAEPNR